MVLTGASPVTTFLAVLRLKCSDTPCGYQEQYRSVREHLPTLRLWFSAYAGICMVVYNSELLVA